MGIENIAGVRQIHLNPGVASVGRCCVLLSREKHGHNSQRQPMRPLGMNSDYVGAAIKRTVLNVTLNVPLRKAATWMANLGVLRCVICKSPRKSLLMLPASGV